MSVMAQCYLHISVGLVQYSTSAQKSWWRSFGRKECSIDTQTLSSQSPHNPLKRYFFSIHYYNGYLTAWSQSFSLVLDGVVEDETNAVALSKHLASSFLIRGAQLSVVRRIEGQYVVQIHTTLLSWIGKRLAAYEHNKNKKSRRIAILFFRVLAPMLSMVDNREALKM